MSDHFHFLIQIKKEEDLEKFISKGPATNMEHSKGISLSFSRLFNSYAKAFNKWTGRHGSVFVRPFKRKKVTRESYLRKLIHYIHMNPVNAGLCSYPGEWSFSSFNEILLEEKGGIVAQGEVLELFHDKENFIAFHKEG